MTIIITNCTSRKRSSNFQGLSVENIKNGSFDDVAAQWKLLLEKSLPEQPASKTYCGRSFREAEKCSDLLNAKLYVVSAGLGVINALTPIPWYNITSGFDAPASIGRKITGTYLPSEWWKVITEKNPYGSSLLNTLDKYPAGLILFALSSPYITLLKSELEALPSQYHPRLRFLGKNTYKILPINLQSNWMPYDDRLEGVGKGYSGTQSDFAQRALKHFVYEVLPMDPTGDAQVHQTITLGFLSNIGKLEKVKGLKKSDDEIVALIKKHWNNGFTGATQVLRIFRGHLGVACEQSRFRDLYKSTKESINAKQ